MTTLATHPFDPPPAGHIDGPHRCHTCGGGYASGRHTDTAGQQQRVMAAHTIGRELRGELARMTGSDGGRADHVLAFADGHVARLLAALDGDSSPAPFLVAARRPGAPVQPPLPLAT